MQPCPSCRRHIRAGRSRCPFCGVVRAAIVALALLPGAARADDAATDADDAAAPADDAAVDAEPEPRPPEAVPIYGAPSPPGGACAGCELGAPVRVSPAAAAALLLAIAARRRKRD